MKEIRNIIGLYDQLREQEVACALATVVRIEGSSYRRIGARLLVGADGRYTGGISGGCLEGDALRRARQAILAGQPSRRVYDTLEGEDREIGIGLGCNGRIEVLFVPLDFTEAENQVEVLRSLIDTRRPRLLVQTVEVPPGEQLDGKLREVPLATAALPKGRSEVRNFVDAQGRRSARLFELVRPELRLIVVGDNYDVLPMVGTAHYLGWRIEVVGLKRKFTTALAALADRLYDYTEAARLRVDEYTAVACMSHDFVRDRQLVEQLLPQQPAYLGLLGPRKRTMKMDLELRQETDLKLLDYSNLYSPIGLDIGAETPEEIAAAVVAEVIAVFRQREGRSLRQRVGTIHGRPAHER